MESSVRPERGLSELLAGLEATPAAYMRAARRIEAGEFPELQPVRLAFVATFTVEPLRPYVMVESARRGLLACLHIAPFNQLEQQILEPSSALYAFEPDAVVIAARLEDIGPTLLCPLALPPARVEEELAAVEARVAALLEGLRQNSEAPALVFNFPPAEFVEAGLADAGFERPVAGLVQRANERLATACRRRAGAYVFDCARVACEVGLDRWRDARLAHLYRVPYSAEAQRQIGRRLARVLRATLRPPCKCLVLDLDNTLWGGVLAEDGLEGIRLGEEYPGSAYKEFQRRVLSLADRGVLLAIASRNHREEALDALARHPDAVLKPKHFAAVQIHWGDKAQSLHAIAAELNVGVDALAFFDDSPVEGEWVRTQVPEVTVITSPDSPLAFWESIDESGAFDQLLVSAEDLQRSDMVRNQVQRLSLKASGVSLEEFLRRLAVRATIGPIRSDTLPRVAQLLAKTNQFNLTTRRHSAAQVEAMIRGGAVGLWMRVSDRFGDSGLVGVVLALPRLDGEWTVDTLLLSCRVIGRRAETALLSELCGEVWRRGGRRLVGEFIPTARNALAATFYRNHGFAPLDGEERFWAIALEKGTVAPPADLEIVRVEAN